MKMIVFILGFALLAFVVYRQLEGTKGTPTVDAQGNVVVQPGQTAPARQLDNVRGAAGRIEQEQQGRVDRAAGMVEP